MANLKSLLLLVLFSGLLLNCSPAQEKLKQTSSPKNSKVNEETKRFESKEDNFSINISHEPFQTRNMGSEIADKKGVDVGKLFVWKFEKFAYTVMYMGPYDRDGNDLPQDWLDLDDGTRKGILNEGGKLISEKPFSYAKYQGREFRSLTKDEVKSITRIYLIDTMGYQMWGLYLSEKDEKEVLEVLDSFKLLKEQN